MGHLLVVVAVNLLAFCVQNILSCAAQKDQKALAVERINQVLKEAKASNGSGTMDLRGYGRGPSSPRYPVAEWPAGTEVIRAPEGGTLVIPCSNPNNTQVSHLAIPPAFKHNGVQHNFTDPAFIWEQLEEPFSCCNCSNKEYIDSSLTAPAYDEQTGAFTIVLENFSYLNTGLYECLHTNGSQWVVTQRYWVSATLFRHNVFSPPMKSVKVRYGDPAEMLCAVRFNFLPGLFGTRFLWRRADYLLWTKSIPEVADAARAWDGFNGHFTFGDDGVCLCNSTMKLNSVTWEDAGVYECWFRINDRLDEWIMQEAYLHVI